MPATRAPGASGRSYGFACFLGEAGAHLARLHGEMRTRKTFALPVVVVAYSGGYVPAAWALVMAAPTSACSAC